MTDRPLGVHDLEWDGDRLSRRALPEHWYWCRKHERAENDSEPVLTTADAANYHAEMMRVGEPGASKPDRPMPCIRIGPFMSEAEANRLHGYAVGGAGVHTKRPLGMETET